MTRGPWRSARVPITKAATPPRGQLRGSAGADKVGKEGEVERGALGVKAVVRQALEERVAEPQRRAALASRGASRRGPEPRPRAVPSSDRVANRPEPEPHQIERAHPL